jgi:hypothetical protein
LLPSRMPRSIEPSPRRFKKLTEGPAGRGPHPRGIAFSLWFNQLTADDQQMVVECVRDAAHAAVFGLLCVLDGVLMLTKGEQGQQP